MRKLSRRALCGTLFYLAAITLPGGAAATPPSETLLCPGLSQPVEIIKDRWGISHIYAKSEEDLFFAQGYNVARDRLFQLEMWRRQATGTVAEILGPQEVERDLGNRLFLFRGDLEQEMNWYHPHGAQIIRAFTEGINAYIAETETHPALLTPEFKMLGIRPGKWTPAVVVSRFNGLLGHADQELMLALAIRAMGVEPVKDVMYFQPSDPKLELDPAIDASLLTKEIMATVHAFRTPLRFTPDELLPAYRSRAATARLNREVPLSEDIRQGIGSNNWVVSGKLT
ncbi:MAG TPA: penicillin acylase family protein, partial [Acidobacteriaceae bacterium]|nr:penicillin acylase family protein [Acidobacteriaceae bacterium]